MLSSSRFEVGPTAVIDEAAGVETIRKGDMFIAGGRVYWIAIEDARRIDHEGENLVAVEVAFIDGGVGTRAWSPVETIALVRAAS